MNRNPFYDLNEEKWFPYATDDDVRAATTFPEAFVSSSDHPAHSQLSWTESAQGVTHDDRYWYITQEMALWRVPINSDLGISVPPGYLKVEIPIPNSDLDPLITHLGDLNWHDGRLYVPAEGGPNARLVVFEAPSLEYKPMFAAALAQGDQAPWCAIDPQSGLLFSSRFDVDTGGLYAYSIEVTDDNGVDLTYIGRFPLFNEQGDAMTLNRVQGGVFSQQGHLYLVSDDGVGIRGFDMYSGQLRLSVPVAYSPHKKADLSYEELEGITLWDLDGRAAPGIGGQLHLLAVKNQLGQDEISFKHYEVAPGEKTRV